MELNNYQEKAMTTCLPSSNNVAYMFLNLVGEVGEFAEKAAAGVNVASAKRMLMRIHRICSEYGLIAKTLRKEPDTLESADLRNALARIAFLPAEQKEALSKELGDIMWQLNGLMTLLNLSAEEVAQQNLDKLADRQEREQIDGDGDER